jgi:hypothetical protein
MVNHRKALERLWTDSCTVYEKEKTKDATTKLTKFTDKVLFTDKICKLSFKTLVTSSENSSAAEVTQVAVLIIGIELNIPPGSKISVTKAGKTVDYEYSGEPGRFTDHQEIPLKLFKGWA